MRMHTFHYGYTVKVFSFIFKNQHNSYLKYEYANKYSIKDSFFLSDKEMGNVSAQFVWSGLEIK